MKVEGIRQIGQMVRTRRKELGLTQRQLANQAGVSDRFIVALELGDSAGARIDKLMTVFTVLGITLEMNISEEGKPAEADIKADAAVEDAPTEQADAQAEADAKPNPNQEKVDAYKQAFTYAVARLKL